MKFRIQVFCKLFVATAVIALLSGCGGSAKSSKTHKSGEHKSGEHKSGEHKSGEHKSGEHKKGEHKEGGHSKKGHEHGGEQGHGAADIEERVKKLASYDEAMHAMGELREQVKHLIESGNLLKVHPPAQGITEIAKRLPELAKKSGIPTSQWRDINIQSRELANMFDEIDVVADAKKKPETEAVFAKMEKLIDGLKAFTPKHGHKEPGHKEHEHKKHEHKEGDKPHKD